MRNHLTLFLLSLTVFLILLPSRGSAFSVGDEREIGEKLLTIVRKEFTLLDEPDLTQYIDTLGKEILAAAGPQYFNFHFFIINNKEINAFAAPSGLIFFHSGLIEVMDTEDELISVMAHEIAHVTQRHIAKRIEKNTKVNAGTMALMLAGIALGKGEVSEAVITSSMAANATLNLQFSRQDEEESDRQAFQLMQTSGRNPAAIVSMLQKMRRMTQFMRGSLPPYLLTHPEPEVRMGYAQDLVSSKDRKEYEETDNFEFLRVKYRIQSLTKRPEDLIPTYLRVTAKEKGNLAIMAQYGLAFSYTETSQFDKALDAIAKVIEHFPEKYILEADLGMIYSRAGKYDQALYHLQKAKTAAPQDVYATFYLAETLQKLGKLTEAASLYEELLGVLPDYTKLYYQLGKLQTDLGSRGNGFYYLGMYHWLQGDSKLAKSYLTQAVGTLPNGEINRTKAEDMLARINKLEDKKSGP